MGEINLLARYPQTRRDLNARLQTKTDKEKEIARRFGRDFFDGDRRYGYGGYTYQPRFWQPVVPDFKKQYAIGPGTRILDVGCGKGFLLYDFMTLIPGVHVAGIDVSEYALDNAQADVRPFLSKADAQDLPFPDASFDLVISINTIHNLARDACRKALQEIQRVTRRHAFITVDAYRDEQEKQRMDAWNLTAQTYMHVDEWKQFFAEAGYRGDYYWFIP